jgi:sulfate adenylyltransferase (ADP) / ATP adenylyltransferase
MTFKKGTLRELIVKTTLNALSSGALLPITTNEFSINDAGIRFLVKIPSSFISKEESRKLQEAAEQAGRNPNPFLPPEKNLIVADISETHIAVLNKFNAVDHHLLIITRQYENQDMLLTQHDFEALWLCMAEFSGLGFYNGGKTAGASQKHKHLQIVPLPFSSSGPPIPIEPLLPVTPAGEISNIPGFTFAHTFARIEPVIVKDPVQAAKNTFELYCSMLNNTGVSPACDIPSHGFPPYCFLMTRDWMLLVPRSKEFVVDISLNSLAYAGSFYVQDMRQFETLKHYGPMKTLADAATPLH